MKQLLKTLIISFIVCTPVITTVGNFQISKWHNPKGYERVFIFGDDLADTGAFRKYTGRYENVGFIEGQETFYDWKEAKFNSIFDSFPFSNLKVGVHETVMALNLNDPQPIVNMPHVPQIKVNLSWDSNFATVGARIAKSDLKMFGINFKNSITKMFADRYNLEQQVEMFRENFTSGEGVAKKGKKNLALLCIGMNDIIDLVEDPRELTMVVKKMADAKIWKLGDILAEQVKLLSEYGITDFIIWNMPDLSKIPKFLKSNNERRELAFEYSLKFNQVVEKVVERWHTKNSQTKGLQNFRIFDFNTHFETYLSSSLRNKYNILKPALTFDFNMQFLRGNFFATFNDKVNLENMDTHTFATETHLSWEMHRFLSKELYKFINN